LRPIISPQSQHLGLPFRARDLTSAVATVNRCPGNNWASASARPKRNTGLPKPFDLKFFARLAATPDPDVGEFSHFLGRKERIGHLSPRRLRVVSIIRCAIAVMLGFPKKFRGRDMRKMNVVDWAGAFALASVSILFFIWACPFLPGVRDTSKWNWTAFEAWGTWVAGLATLGAVLASLLIASHSYRREERKDFLRARMTALRYIGPLIEIHVALNTAKIWVAARAKMKLDATGDTAMIQGIASLALPVSFDDLVLLAPLEGDFSVRLHALSLQLAMNKSHVAAVRNAMSSMYNALNNNADARQIEECDAQLERVLASLEEYIESTKEILLPLMAEGARVAYSRSHSNS
jgi:hypothetical protein